MLDRDAEQVFKSLDISATIGAWNNRKTNPWQRAL
jgi:hypothetical protein